MIRFVVWKSPWWGESRRRCRSSQTSLRDHSGSRTSNPGQECKEPKLGQPCHRWRRASVQFSCLVMSDSLRSHEPQHTRPSLSITNSQSPPKPMSVESVMPSNHLILCRPLLLPPSIFPSIRVFSNESAVRTKWPKVLEFQLKHLSFQ